MGRVECWSPLAWAGDASPQSFIDQAVRFEDEGWDGTSCADTQCMMPEAFTLLGMIAHRTRRIKLGTGITVPLTRHPAVAASAIAAIQAISCGRAGIGIGRGDTALAYLGASPVRLSTFENFVDLVRRYLAGETLPLAEVVPTGRGAVPGFDTLAVGKAPPGSRLLWLDPKVPKVPVEVTATGPKALAMAGRLGDRVALNLGVNPERVKWGIDIVRRAAAAAGRDPHAIGITIYLPIGCTIAGSEARMRELVQPFVMANSRFAIMDKNVTVEVSPHDRAVLESLAASYDITQHVRRGQTRIVDDEFIDNYAIIGSPDQCVRRLLDLVAIGVDRFMMTCTTPDTPEFKAMHGALVERVIPELRRAAAG